MACARNGPGRFPGLFRAAGLFFGRGFIFGETPLYTAVPVSAGYGDKLWCAIGTADPGAVPGGSTITTPF